MSNPLRGEVLLEGESGKEYGIVYTVDALLMIESKVQFGPLDLINRAVNQQLTMTELTVCVWAGMEGYRRAHGAGGKPVNPAVAPKVITDCGGYLQVMIAVAQSLTQSQALGLTSDEDEDDEEPDPTGTGDEPSI